MNDERGSVIETLVSRTLRQVEVQQSMIRIVGLSATLPNYSDVASFLRVHHPTGLFVFDASFRPVPLRQQFIGVSEPNIVKKKKKMLEICYEKTVNALRNAKQVMVFVHSRKDTLQTCQQLIELAMKNSDGDDLSLFTGRDVTTKDNDNKTNNIATGTNTDPKYANAVRDVSRSKASEVKMLFEKGFGIHHAGMLRSDRHLTERLFSEGLIRVLCCTATLAWGVNLPAHTVIIKGTEVYDQQVLHHKSID